MYNKKLLSQIVNNLDSRKKPSEKKDIDYVSQQGYSDNSPFRKRKSITIFTENGLIDMSKTKKPLLANGRYLPPYSGIHKFNTNVVTEKPLDEAKQGGERPELPKKKGSKGYSRSVLATNKLFTQNPLTKKPKSKKRKVFDPNAKYYQDGGTKTQYYTYGKSKNQYKKVGNKWYISNDVTDFKWQPIHDPTGNRAKELNKNAKVNPNPWVRPTNTFEGKLNAAMGDTQGQSARAAAFYARPGEDDVDNLRHADSGKRTQQAIAKATGSDLLGYYGSIGLGAAHELGTMFSDPRSWGDVLQEAYEDMVNNARGARMGYYHTPNATKRLNYLSKTFAMPDGYGAVRPFPGSTWTDPYAQKQRLKAQQEVWNNPNPKPVSLTEKFEKGGFQDDLGKHQKLLRDWTYGADIGMLHKAQTGGEYYTFQGTNYMKQNGKWLKEVNGKYVPLTKGDIAKRSAVLDAQAHKLSPYELQQRARRQSGTSLYDPLYQKAIPSETTKLNIPVSNINIDKAIREKEAQRQATIQAVRQQPLLSQEEKADILMDLRKLDEYNYLTKMPDPGTVTQTKEQSLGSRAWDIITNPFDAFEYSVRTGDISNMPHNYNAMRIAGIDPSAGQGSNLVGDALNSSYNLFDAGDKLVRNVGEGNYGEAFLQGLRFIPGSRLSTGLGSKLYNATTKIPSIPGMPSYGKDLWYSAAHGRKLPTYKTATRWQPDVFPESLVQAGKKELTPDQQSLTGSWYGYSPGIKKVNPDANMAVGFYMRTRPGAGNINTLRLSQRQINELETAMPDFAKGMSGKTNTQAASTDWMKGELNVPIELRQKAKTTRFDVNPREYVPSQLPSDVDPTSIYAKTTGDTETGTFVNDLIESQYRPIMGIPRKYFPYKKGGYIKTKLTKAQKGKSIPSQDNIMAMADPVFYTYPGSKGVYRKINGKWEVDWNRTGNFQPLAKGDLKKRYEQLNKGAKKLDDFNYLRMIYDKYEDYGKEQQFQFPQKNALLENALEFRGTHTKNALLENAKEFRGTPTLQELYESADKEDLLRKWNEGLERIAEKKAVNANVQGLNTPKALIPDSHYDPTKPQYQNYIPKPEVSESTAPFGDQTNYLQQVENAKLINADLAELQKEAEQRKYAEDRASGSLQYEQPLDMLDELWFAAATLGPGTVSVGSKALNFIDDIPIPLASKVASKMPFGQSLIPQTVGSALKRAYFTDAALRTPHFIESVEKSAFDEKPWEETGLEGAELLADYALSGVRPKHIKPFYNKLVGELKPLREGLDKKWILRPKGAPELDPTGYSTADALRFLTVGTTLAGAKGVYDKVNKDINQANDPSLSNYQRYKAGKDAMYNSLMAGINLSPLGGPMGRAIYSSQPASKLFFFDNVNKAMKGDPNGIRALNNLSSLQPIKKKGGALVMSQKQIESLKRLGYKLEELD